MPPAPTPAPEPPDPGREVYERFCRLARECGFAEPDPLKALSARTRASRLAKCRARAADGLLARWGEFEAAVRSDPFYAGGGARRWRADIAWLMTQEGWLNAIERARAHRPADDQAPKSEQVRAIEAIIRAAGLVRGAHVRLGAERLTVADAERLTIHDAEGRYGELPSEVLRAIGPDPPVDLVELGAAVWRVLTVEREGS